ncbi:hydroxymethylbilane synthase [Pelotomaculum propionicicum]|uniref:hydroxymethylbilane synthase n=1 Tax=Pelotomaculum propionicicum TaxID=258475 RepID=UPI003B76033D
MKQEIVVGTRESRLAMWQACWVVERLKSLSPGHSYRIKGIRTQGDNILDVALAKIGDKGLFTKELEYAILRGEIDMAVHSMKDLPTDLPDGLTIGAVCEREYPGDVLISRGAKTLAELPAGAVIGTSSLRRAAQVLHYRNDLKTANLRGNVQTRIKKLDENRFDATILAYAGVHRMGLDHRVTQVIPFEILLPAVGQGAVGVEAASDNVEMLALLKNIDHKESRLAVSAERALLRKLEGGCQVPIGAHAAVEGECLRLEGAVVSLDGAEMVRTSLIGDAADAEDIGVRLAEKLLETGAGEILNMMRQENRCDG